MKTPMKSVDAWWKAYCDAARRQVTCRVPTKRNRLCICFVLLDYLRAHVSSGLTVTVTLHDVRPQGESYSVRAERVSAEIKSRWTGSEASS